MRLLRVLGDLTLQVGIILICVASVLALMRDSFHIFTHDSFAWLIALKQLLVGTLLEQPAVTTTVHAIAAIMRRTFAVLGIDANLYPQSYWTHIFVPLAIALGGCAHALRDFKTQPANSIFRYANALVCAFLGSVLAASAAFGHPGLFVWPVASLLVFFGNNAVWQAIFSRAPADRLSSSRVALLCLVSAALIAVLAFRLSFEGMVSHPPSSLGPIMFALLAAAFGAWFMRYGLSAIPSNEAGQQLGTQIVVVLGIAAMVVLASHATFRMARPALAQDVFSGGAGFQDCEECPGMIAIQAGQILMGTTEEEAEQLKAARLWKQARHIQEMPANERKTSSFALARTEVTIAQYYTFMQATGYKPGGQCWGLHEGKMDFHPDIDWITPGFTQSPNHPVVCVNWLDAQAYVRWLSLRTGETYRLPTEAEWEYAARAGSRSSGPISDSADTGCTSRNAADVSAKHNFPDWDTFTCDDGSAFTAPVGSYRPNDFGLFDMTGNVWEWVQDCYAPLHAGPTSGEAQQPSCSNRVIRGGSWNYGPGEVRAATRDSHTFTTRGSGLGFRVARDLDLPS